MEGRSTLEACETGTGLSQAFLEASMGTWLGMEKLSAPCTAPEWPSGFTFSPFS